jgi:outer membrane protein assembly factor BamB
MRTNSGQFRRHWLLLLGIALATSAMAQDWPSFRGPNASGIGAGSPPDSWDIQKGTNTKWKTPIPGLGLSSPVVWGDRVYLTTAIAAQGGYDLNLKPGDKEYLATDQVNQSWRLVALDLRSGRIVWQTTVSEGVPRAKRHVKSSYANASAVTDGRSIVAAFSSGTLACLDRNGKIRWKHKFEVPAKPNEVNDIGSSPILYRSLVILQHDIGPKPFLAAFNLADGKEVWKVERPESYTWSTPAIVSYGGRDVLVTNSAKQARGQDPLTGKELWRLPTRKGSWDRGPAPLAAKDFVIIAGGGPEQSIVAIRHSAIGDLTLPASQTSSEHIAWTTECGSPYMPTPIIYGEQLYVLNEKGILTAYELASGRRLFQNRVSQTGADFTASPVAANGKLYLTSDDGEDFVVRAGQQFELLATNAMGSPCLATPAIAGSTLLIRTRDHLVAIGDSARASR